MGKQTLFSLKIQSQVLRSAGSVSANIAEGYGRFYEQAYRNHLSIARGSLFETESWIDLLVLTGYLSDDMATSLFERCHEVGRLLTNRMKELQPKGLRVREGGDIYEANSDQEDVVS